MNAIRTSVKEQSFLTAFKSMNFRSSTGIPGALVGVIEQAFSAIGMLMDSLVQETDSIVSFAEAYADMDVDLGNLAGKIMPVIEEPASASNSSGKGSGGYYGGGGTDGGSGVPSGGSKGSGVTPTPDKGDEKPNKETDVVDNKPADVTPTPQPINNTPSNEVNVSNVTPEETVPEEVIPDDELIDELPVEDEPEEVIPDDELIDELPVEDEPEEVTPEEVTPTPSDYTPATPGKKKGSHLGTIAGIAAVGLGAAGVAYEVNKKKKEKEFSDDEEFKFDDSDFETDDDSNDEINLQDDI